MSEARKGGTNIPKPGEQGFQKSKAGKVAPTASALPKIKSQSNLSNPILLPPGSLKPMTANNLDWQQDYEDYLFGIQDMWDSFSKGDSPSVEVMDYYEEKAKAISRIDFGKQVLLGDLESFRNSNDRFTKIGAEILKEILLH